MARRVINHDLPGFVAKMAEVLELQGVKLTPALRAAAAKDRAAYFKRQQWLAREATKSKRAADKQRLKRKAFDAMLGGAPSAWLKKPQRRSR